MHVNVHINRLQILRGDTPLTNVFGGPNGYCWRLAFKLDMEAALQGVKCLDFPAKLMLLDNPTGQLLASQEPLEFSTLEPVLREEGAGKLVFDLDRTLLGYAMVFVDQRAVTEPENVPFWFGGLGPQLAKWLQTCWYHELPPDLRQLASGTSASPALPKWMKPREGSLALHTWLNNGLMGELDRAVRPQYGRTPPGGLPFQYWCRILTLSEVLAQPSQPPFRPLAPHAPSTELRVEPVGEVSTSWALPKERSWAIWKPVAQGFRSTVSASSRAYDQPDGPPKPLSVLDVVGATANAYSLGISWQAEKWQAPLTTSWPLGDPPLALRLKGEGATVFARGPDGCLRGRAFIRGVNWGPEFRIEGVLTSPVVGIEWGQQHHYCLAARGANGNVQVLMGLPDKSTWTPLGGAGSGRLSLVSWGAGRLDLFGRSNKNTLLHWWYTNERWNGPEDLGGAITSDPAAVSWGANRLDVFGLTPQRTIQHHYYSGAWGSWTMPEPVDLTGQLSAVSSGAGHIALVSRTTQGRLVLVQWPDKVSGQAKWRTFDLGGSTHRDPIAVCHTPLCLDLLAVDEHGVLMHAFRRGPDLLK